MTIGDDGESGDNVAADECDDDDGGDDGDGDDDGNDDDDVY